MSNCEARKSESEYGACLTVSLGNVRANLGMSNYESRKCESESGACLTVSLGNVKANLVHV